RRSSPGLTERDVRIIETNLESLEKLSPRRTLHPARVLPKPSGPIPEMQGVRPTYAAIHRLETQEGRFLSEVEESSSAAVCVLGQSAKVSLIGYQNAVGQYIKVNDTWLRVVGVLGEQFEAPAAGSKGNDRSNTIFIPLSTFQFRFWEASRFLKDEL